MENHYEEEDFYNQGAQEELLEEDEISPEEQGFMAGYMAEEEV